jgi:uncharacterized protein (UPF0276 family)
VSSRIELGLALNLDARLDPALLKLAMGGDYVEYSAPLQLEEARGSPAFLQLEAERATRPMLFHPVHLNLYGPELEGRERLAQLAEHLTAVGSPWVSNDVAWWHVEERPFPGFLYLPPPLTARGVEDASAHAQHVQAALPVPLLLENPTVMEAEGDLHVLDFMAQLHQRTGLGLILDVGHLFAYQLARGLPLSDGLDGFPFSAVREIHIAGGHVTGRDGARIYADDHAQGVRDELFELLGSIAPRCGNLRAVTFEADGLPAPFAAAQWERIRATLPSSRGGVEDRHPDPVAVPASLDSRGAWEVYAHRFEADARPGIPALERGYRLATLAFELDRSWPITRLMMAPTAAGLHAFQSSAEFRSQFSSGGPELGQAFGRYLRRRLAAHPDPALEVVAAFETWLLARAPAGGDPGRPGRFPRDLTELLGAYHSLRRHRAQRAWGMDAASEGDVEILAQAAMRGPQRSWQVGVRRGPEGVRPYLLDGDS